MCSERKQSIWIKIKKIREKNENRALFCILFFRSFHSDVFGARFLYTKITTKKPKRENTRISYMLKFIELHRYIGREREKNENHGIYKVKCELFKCADT